MSLSLPAFATENPASTSVAAHGLSVDADGVLKLNGKPFRGVGVNYFNAFYRTLLAPTDTSYKAGFSYLQGKRIPFIRFMASGFWPVEYQLYLTDRQKYFAQLDEFVRAAESQGIGLIPTLFWNTTSISDLVGEPRNQWGNPNSKTIAFMRTYTAEIVSRYKNSPAIWGWEFSNEMNVFADYLDQAKRYRPELSRTSGTPAFRTADDDITSDHIRIALTEFAAAVRKIDPHRILISGNDIPGPNAENRYKKAGWSKDSRSGYAAMMLLQNPDRINTMSIHLYPHRAFMYFEDGRASLKDIIETSMAVSVQNKKPLYIGEFGAPRSLGAQQERTKFQELLNHMEASKVPLAALWVFDLSAQNKEWNVAPDRDRVYQLDLIAKLNERIRSELGL